VPSPFRAWINPLEFTAPTRSTLWRRLSSAQLFVGSFLSLILLGTLGLRLVPGLYTGAQLGWLDAAFMATSAVCVTGLAVVDPATSFTIAGQAFLLVLIQLGGLGMITFTTAIILALGRRLSLRQETLTASATEAAPHISPKQLLRDVLLFTFGLELAGAVALLVLWGPERGWSASIWPAVFHAVSAFCNAGFSTFSDSLIGFQRSPLTLLVIGSLIIAGGIGFLTIEELTLAWRARREGRAAASVARPARLSLHSRLVLSTTAVLLLGGWMLLGFSEWRGELSGLGTADRLVNALFMSLTPRTAGFNTIDYSLTSDSTNFVTILLMFIGGSPGSTAGGIKTTTFALLVILAISRFHGQEITSIRHRSLPEQTVQRAVGLMAGAFTAVTVSILVLTWGGVPGVQRGAFLSIMFEVVSAFNTVGLSMGITGELSPGGRILTIVLMFVGRVGPLTFASALAAAARRHRNDFRYAYEDVVVG
jgi:trk system potassium uptake protein